LYQITRTKFGRSENRLLRRLLLVAFEENGHHVTGCDPSPAGKIAKRRYGIPLVPEFFGDGLFSEASFDVVIGRQVLEHIKDPVSFLRSIRRILRRDGLVALEVPDVQLWMRYGVIGTFFPEHLSYFSRLSLKNLVTSIGFDIVSMRQRHTDIFLVARKSENIEKQTILFDPEELQRISTLLTGYPGKIQRMKTELSALIHQEKNNGKSIVVYGAGVHTTGLFSLLQLGEKEIDHVIDDNKAVWGKYIPGFNKAIGSPALLEELDHKYLVIVSGFSYQEEILHQLEKVRSNQLEVVILYPKIHLI